MAVPGLWRTKKQRYSLQGATCSHCGQAVFPVREVCPHCHKPVRGVAADHFAFDFSAMMQSPATAAPVTATAGDD